MSTKFEKKKIKFTEIIESIPIGNDCVSEISIQFLLEFRLHFRWNHHHS